jgi:cytochrome b pre-mRNA-processing protein 3
MSFKRLISRGRDRGPVRALYRRLVAQARDPGFYRHAGVPDTLDGRFEMIVLHVFLVLRRLKRAQGAADELSRALTEALFEDMDRNLREIGVGDLSVGKHVKRMASAFRGRLAAYDAALAAGDDALAAALERNLYGTVSPASAEVARMVSYLRRECQALDAQSTADLSQGGLEFGPAPGPEQGAVGAAGAPPAAGESR